MEQDIGEVMTAGVQSVELAVQHVREPGQGMPVMRMAVSEGPADAGQGQTLYNLRIIIHILVVIIIDKPMTERLAEDQKYGDCQQQANARNHTLAIQA